jgi:hypothetical protein
MSLGKRKESGRWLVNWDGWGRRSSSCSANVVSGRMKRQHCLVWLGEKRWISGKIENESLEARIGKMRNVTGMSRLLRALMPTSWPAMFQLSSLNSAIPINLKPCVYESKLKYKAVPLRKHLCNVENWRYWRYSREPAAQTIGGDRSMQGYVVAIIHSSSSIAL